jgi:hypothetical protein
LATFDERQRVSLLAAVNTPQAEIARVLKCSEPWLRKTFRAELDTGAALKRAELLDITWRAAKKGNAAAIKLMDEKLTRAELERFDQQAHGSGALSGAVAAPAPKVEPLGKKAQADADAVELIDTDPEVAALFAVRPSRPPATH